MQKLKNRDLELLETNSNQNLSKIWILSRERVRQIRNENNYEKFDTRQLIHNKIQDDIDKYIIEYNPLISIFQFKKLYRHFNIKRKQFYNSAEKLNINIFFDDEFEHSYSKYKVKTCTCDICTLVFVLSQYDRNTKIENKLIISSSISKMTIFNYIANRFITKYKEDKGWRKKEFYSFLRNYLKKSDYDILKEIAQFLSEKRKISLNVVNNILFL